MRDEEAIEKISNPELTHGNVSKDLVTNLQKAIQDIEEQHGIPAAVSSLSLELVMLKAHGISKYGD